MSSFIDLDRRFFEIPKAGGLENSLDVQIAQIHSESISWSDLLSERCAVILGEAGSGKTTELKGCVERCRAEGKAAFFISVEALASDGLRDALDPGHLECFNCWFNSQDFSFFFLDSLDEAKLRRHTLERALRKLSQGLGRSITRTNIYLSCRVSDWNTYGDGDKLTDFLSAALGNGATSEDRKTSLFRVFGIAPLSFEQVQKLIEIPSKPETDGFMQAIVDARVQPFVERPADVLWLARFWHKKKRLGPWREVVEANAREKLRDPSRPAELRPSSEQRAWEGALRLAGAATLSGRVSILVSGEKRDTHAGTQELDATLVLDDWQPLEIDALLRLPLFDESTFGRVRIHERTVQEYLAAKWLSTLSDNGLPRRELDHLLFPRTPFLDDPVLRPGLRGMAAWLALDDAHVRRTLAKVSPETLLGEGDPAGIPVDERQAILKNYLNRYKGSRRAYNGPGALSLRRFAYEGLGSLIQDVLLEREFPEDVREALLTIVAEGQIYECTAVATKIASDQTEPVEVRSVAISAMAATLEPQVRRSTILDLCNERDVHPSISREIIKALFPIEMDDQAFERVIRAVTSKPRNIFTGLDYVMEYEVPRQCPPNRRVQLAKVLLGILEDSDRQDLDWLQHSLLALVRAALKGNEDDPALAFLIDRLFIYFEKKNEGGRFHSFATDEAPENLLIGHPRVRKELFWLRVHNTEKAKSRRISRYRDIRNPHWLLKLGREDWEWLAFDSLHSTDDAARVLAFDTLLKVNTSDAETSKHEEISQGLAQQSPILARHVARLYGRCDMICEGQEANYRRLNTIFRNRVNHKRAKEREALEGHLEQIRHGQHPRALQHLLYVGGAGEVWREANTKKVEEIYGPEIAEAFVEGLKRYWRQADVPMPHEWTEVGKIPAASVLANLGVTLEVSEGLTPSKLTSDLRKLVLRIAAWKLNSLPDWFEEVALLEAEETLAIFAPQIKHEMMLEDDEPRALQIDRLCRRPNITVRALFADEVIQGLTAADPKRLDVLRTSLQFLAGLPAVQGEVGTIQRLAPTRCENARSEAKRLAIWLTFWMNHDGNSALDFLTSLLADQDVDRAGLIMEEVLSEMWARGDDHLPYPIFNIHTQPDVLARLLPLAFKHVPRATDLHHESVYCPGRRDHAQDVRDRLIAWLCDRPPEESVVHLRQLSEDPVLVDIRDYLLYCLRERVTAGNSCDVWSPDEIVRWGKSFTRMPSNSLELFEAIWRHLQDIKDDLENGDHSHKNLFNPALKHVEEAVVQNELMRELNRGAHNRYTAVAEEEIGSNNYPDIRCHKPEVLGSITIEVKIAERWSYKQLQNSIQHQIVARYLRDRNSNYAILAIGSSGPQRKEGWINGDRSLIQTFADLVEQLSRDAKEIANKERMKEVRVIGIDFH